MQQKNLSKENTMTVTQTNEIKAYLKNGYRITAIDALQKFGCFRLAARIKDLKDEGMEIDKVMVETVSGARVAQYYSPSKVRT
jgi:hypothetical protein